RRVAAHRHLPARRRPDRGVAAHRAEARLPPLGPPRRTPRRPPLTVDGRPAAREPARLRSPRTRGRPRARGDDHVHAGTTTCPARPRLTSAGGPPPPTR